MRVAWVASIAWLLYLVAIPFGYMVVDSLTEDGLTLQHFADFASDPKLRAATVNSLLVATGVAMLSVLVGAPLAFGVARTKMRGKGLVRATIIVSLISPDFLIAMAYIALAGPNAGYFNRIIRDGMGIGSGPTAAGVCVTPELALTVPAVYACCSVLAQDVASQLGPLSVGAARSSVR